MSHRIDLGTDVVTMVDVLIDKVDDLADMDLDEYSADFDPVKVCVILEAIATVATAICSLIHSVENDGME